MFYFCFLEILIPNKVNNIKIIVIIGIPVFFIAAFTEESFVVLLILLFGSGLGVGLGLEVLFSITTTSSKSVVLSKYHHILKLKLYSYLFL